MVNRRLFPWNSKHVNHKEKCTRRQRSGKRSNQIEIPSDRKLRWEKSKLSFSYLYLENMPLYLEKIP